MTKVLSTKEYKALEKKYPFSAEDKEHFHYIRNEDVIETNIGRWFSDETCGEAVIEWSANKSKVFVRTHLPLNDNNKEVLVEVCKITNERTYQIVLETKILLVGEKLQDVSIYMEEMKIILSILK